MPVGVVVNAIGTVEEVLADRSIGVVGSAGQLATYGNLVAGDFPGSASLTTFYDLDTDANDNSSNGKNLTNSGVVFTGVGFFGNEKIANFGPGTNSYLESSDAHFQMNGTDFTFGGWVYLPNNAVTNKRFFTKFGSPGNRGYSLGLEGGTTLTFAVSTDGTTVVDTSTNISSLKGSWIHVAASRNNTGGATKLYVNGQLAASGTAATAFASTANFRAGYAAGGFDPFDGLMHNAFVHRGLLTDAQVLTIYSKRFKGQQIAGGHVLQADSFPLVSLTNKAAIYNLSGLTDASVNAKTLTNTGSTLFNGLNIFGVADCAVFSGAQSLSSTDALFNPGNGRSFGFGAYFAALSWQNSYSLIGNSPGGGDRGFALAINGGVINYAATNTAGSYDVNVTSPSIANLVAGSWHHIIFMYDYQYQIIKIYLDGVLFASNPLTNQRAVTSSSFVIGGATQFGSAFNGKIDEAFWVVDYVLTDSDVRKIYSSRIDLSGTSALITPNNQRWRATMISEDGLNSSDLDGQAFIADKSPSGKVWLDFGGATTNDPASRVNLRLMGG